MSGAPTGCYKCGRVGHWSRDCTFDAKQDPGATPPPPPPSSSNGIAVAAPAKSSVFREPRRSKRKLTPELLLSKEGLGYVLEQLPHRYPIKGRGHEAEDLRNLLRGYRHWQSNFFPSLSFKRFSKEVAAMGRVKRIKTRLKELRAKIVVEKIDPKDLFSGNQDNHHSFPGQVAQESVPKFGALSKDDPEYVQKMARMEANRLRALELARARRAREAAAAESVATAQTNEHPPVSNEVAS